MKATHTYGQLDVGVHDSNDELGAAAASDFAAVVKSDVAANGTASVILATGNSQLTFLGALRQRHDIPWDRVTVFHMDEYVGMPASHPASFRRYMTEKLVRHVRPSAFHGLMGDAESVEDEMERYAGLLEQAAPVVCVMGIGENGHLAFNDPPANFENPEPLEVVTLANASRQQQVDEGHFASFGETPEQAITLTIPTLLAPSRVMVLVPEARKAAAVRAAMEGPITPECPASILRDVPQAQLYLDRDSARELVPFAQAAPG
jgi:glucosamine-6-phosphate deaminase